MGCLQRERPPDATGEDREHPRHWRTVVCKTCGIALSFSDFYAAARPFVRERLQSLSRAIAVAREADPTLDPAPVRAQAADMIRDLMPYFLLAQMDELNVGTDAPEAVREMNQGIQDMNAEMRTLERELYELAAHYALGEDCA